MNPTRASKTLTGAVPWVAERGNEARSGGAVSAGGERSPGAASPLYAAAGASYLPRPATVSGALAAHPRAFLNPRRSAVQPKSVAVPPECAGSESCANLPRRITNPAGAFLVVTHDA
jgi:hypothetical protein